MNVAKEILKLENIGINNLTKEQQEKLNKLYEKRGL